MNILFWEWKAFGKEDIIECFHKLGHKVKCIENKNIHDRNSEQFDNEFAVEADSEAFDFVFSINYCPIISENCMKHHLKYVSIVYDSPLVALYSYTIVNSCNYIFLFDSAQYLELKNGGIQTVYYLPLAVNLDRIDRMVYNQETADKFTGDISFVGAMYNEKHNLFEKLDGLSAWTRGYLEGIMSAQLKVYGEFFIEQLLTDRIVNEMKTCVEYNRNADGIETPAYVYANYFIGRKLAELERHNLLAAASEHYHVKLYTYNKTPDLLQIQNMGPVDYYDTMPYVFRYSKINLNITLRTIKSGIPLRGMDIMGCSGFLLTNYQQDYFRHFIPGEDFVYYESCEDMLQKCSYYLSHNSERKQIAENAYGKIKDKHDYTIRLREILEIAST